MQLRQFLEKILTDVCAVVEYSGRKTVCVTDVVWALHRQGRTIYVSTQLRRRSNCSMTDCFKGFGTAETRGRKADT